MSELFVPTARNSERFVNRHVPEYGRAEKYVPGAHITARKEDRQAALRKAAALRHAFRLERHCDIAFSGNAFDRGCLRILEQLLTVREAENIDVLYLRDRVLTGLIDGAWAFEAITKEAYGRLRDLHSNAFDLRHKELIQ